MAPDPVASSRAAYIEQLHGQATLAIASDELRRSLDRLHALVDETTPKNASGVVLLASRLSSFEKRTRDGLLDASAQKAERNELAASLLAEADALRHAALEADRVAQQAPAVEQPASENTARRSPSRLAVRRSASDPDVERSLARPVALTAGEVVIRAEDLTLRLGSNTVVDGVGFDVAAGEILAIVGRNGAGKSSLVRLLALDASADRGTVAYPFAEARGLTTTETRDRIGYLEQRTPSYTGRVGQLLELTLMLREAPTAETDAELTAISSRFGLAGQTDLRWPELSGGYRTRFELARLLLCRPALLILDEPLAALDPPSQIRYLETLRDLARSPRCPGIVITSQHVAEVQALADTLLVIEGGRVRYHGPPTGLRAAIGRGVFEYRGALDRSGVDAALAALGSFSTTPTGVTMRLETTDPVAAEEVLRALAAGGAVELFRDLSGSALVLLDEGAES